MDPADRNPRMEEKLQKLHPDLLSKFWGAVDELYKQESDGMVAFLEESRRDLLQTKQRITAEQHALKATSRMLAEERLRQEGSKSRTQTPRTSIQLKSQEADVDTKLAVERYMRRKEKTEKGQPAEDIQGEAQKVLRDLNSATTRTVREQERQAELVRQQKEKQATAKETNKEKAEELIMKEMELEKAQEKEKEQQTQKLRERLEEKKKSARDAKMPEVGI